MTYAPRTIDLQLDRLLPEAPAIAIDGAKAVGKTVTAARRANASWLLDDPDQLALLESDPKFRSAPAGTLLIDEWQRLPQIWDSVRRAVDAGAPPGRFLMTGSATPRPGTDTHTGAGRVVRLRMRPMALYERGVTESSVSLASLLEGDAEVHGATQFNLAQYLDEIVASGFPGIRGHSPELRTAMLDSYIDSVIDRELPDAGLAVRRPETLRRWLAAYAAASSTPTQYSRILDATTAGDGSQPAKTTTIAYRDFLSSIWMLDPVPGWSHSRNPLRSLQTSPKHQLADPALAARLLNLTARALGSSRGAFMAGPLFESLATLSVRVAASAAMARVGHLRTARGEREVDLMVEGSEGQVVGVEVKLTAAPNDADVRHLLWLREQLPNDVVDLVIVTTGERAYRRADGVAVVPLALFGP